MPASAEKIDVSLRQIQARSRTVLYPHAECSLCPPHPLPLIESLPKRSSAQPDPSDPSDFPTVYAPGYPLGT